ncbi:sugar kinase [Erythrobacter sp. NAP1]|uniref:bifunctional ADP-dependent NAD(P)H-hydrate dehydratase/NAD(P)H-hydrate epimerase n=1 Tax=Erythrobacter sp. NAP1 TaxID=237727 RepID=UPI0000686EFF|nr:bifunctional ADP-dependent NAD(P)H-hydrate dehydratase/NAD(P)H-hydrate epimerase [Erythrobacter sp. NAP1]EAQ30335.1 sugar kinase [Erythrobacter sp. NAP1]
MSNAQVLSAFEMQAAEQRIFDTGTSVFELMEAAAGGAAEWIRRLAAGRSVTVLCGPGNNGGDGYVIAHHLREAGNEVTVIAPVEPKTDAAKQARNLWGGAVQTSGRGRGADVFVDSLFGSGLSRPLSGEHALLLRDLAERHAFKVAIDVPSGTASDTGALLNDKLPDFDVTLALGAWKFAHWLLPGRPKMGARRLVPIGVEPVEGAAQVVTKPRLSPPAVDAHKYRRGLAAIVGGKMPGAAILATEAAMRSGAGYVKLLGTQAQQRTDPGLVVDTSPLADAMADERIDAVLLGPGLGRDEEARDRLSSVLSAGKPVVLDADALVLLRPEMVPENLPVLATPHDGELEALCRAFSVIAESRRDRAIALARSSGMVVLAKGPDSVIAAPDGRIALLPPAPSWLSVAGTGDVLAGIAVSRMASGATSFDAACEAAWLHGRTAERCGAAFTPLELAHAVPGALAECL